MHIDPARAWEIVSSAMHRVIGDMRNQRVSPAEALHQVQLIGEQAARLAKAAEPPLCQE